jgi:hypothetical protein
MGAPTAADLRAEVARHRLRLYDLASAAGMHPTRLGAVLNERVPMPVNVGQRIMAAIGECRGGAIERRAR